MARASNFSIFFFSLPKFERKKENEEKKSEKAKNKRIEK